METKPKTKAQNKSPINPSFEKEETRPAMPFGRVVQGRRWYSLLQSRKVNMVEV
ncbi:MAG: hypothetical protein HON76_05520 [Candidatus Scalindua sp.]|jgi:hypothetical protein|nr:hypothetical protein [Candidatus Scalindua sp.]